MTVLDASQMERPIIAVVPKYLTADRLTKNISSCDSLLIANNYFRAVMAAGGLPMLFPITEDESVLESVLELVDGILLTGGADLDPRLYGGNAEDANLGVHVDIRERAEYRVLDYIFAHDVPMLGICRGIQLLNVYQGGTLYEHLADHLPETDEDGVEIKHWQDIDYSLPSHKVRLVEGTLVADMLGVDEVMTNSMHHQGIKQLSPNLQAMAYGPGGLVEAVCVPELTFAVGLQWHPEYLGAHADMNRIFERLVSEAKDYRLRK